MFAYLISWAYLTIGAGLHNLQDSLSFLSSSLKPKFFELVLLAEMEPLTPYLISAIAAGMGMGLVKLIDYLRRRDADKEAAAIIERAEVEATSRRKEVVVEAKELALKEKAELDEANSVIREKLHQRERQLDKGEDTLQQRSDQLQKQEKMVENNQRRLAEKMEDAKRESIHHIQMSI